MKAKKKRCVEKMKRKTESQSIQRKLFRMEFILIITLAVILGVAGTMVNINFETQKRDRNLQNVAETIANSPLTVHYTSDMLSGNEQEVFVEYLDSVKESLDDIDVISVVGIDNIRLYHSNHQMIGTVYDGTIPFFAPGSEDYYPTSENGPSGAQRRAYAAIYDEEGKQTGFVMSIMLMENIQTETKHTLLLFIVITVIAVLIELLISKELSENIKKDLLGYEPDAFAAMYRIRNNILESLEEGIVAVDNSGKIQFTNGAAMKMMGSPDIIVDKVPVKNKNDEIVGTVEIMHDRAEYTKLMEDLAGTRYLVDSMRANNHDFTNKLHVILGMIQMEMYDEASAYIENITLVQRETISKVMNIVEEPAAAALLIGKIARASELNVEFIIRDGSRYSLSDMNIPSESLVTILGNLIDNGFDAMNDCNSCRKHKKMMLGIYSQQDALLINVTDTGHGIPENDMKHIFENGYSTKGEGHGTGLFQVKNIVESLGGTITAESDEGNGTSFSVKFQRKNMENKNV